MRLKLLLPARLTALVPSALACIFILLAGLVGSGRVLTQEPSQSSTSTQPPATTAPDSTQQPAQASAPAPASPSDQTQTEPQAPPPDAAQQQGPSSEPGVRMATGPAAAAANKPKVEYKQVKLGPKDAEDIAHKDPDGLSLIDAGPFSEPDAGSSTGKNKRTTEITEEELRALLLKKELYIRGSYLSDTLEFNEHGNLVSKSPVGSYTLSSVEIEHIEMTKHKIILEGTRYGLHFLGNLGDDPNKNVAMIKLAPAKKKKTLTITIDREIVVNKPKEKAVKIEQPKPVKQLKGKAAIAEAAKHCKPLTSAAPAAVGEAATPADGSATPTPETAAAAAAASQVQLAPCVYTPGQEAAVPPPPAQDPDIIAAEEAAKPPAPILSPEDQAKAEVLASIAAAKPEERPADANSVTHTYSPVHASRVLRQALNNVFSVGLDAREMESMPDMWKHYYESENNKAFYKFQDPTIVKLSSVDSKPALLKALEPNTNQYAQENGIVGISRYRAVIGADGKASDIAITLPIGFGLDENASEAIHKANFKPAMKDGQPVSTVLDLYVTFRIYSKLTSPTNVTVPKDPSTLAISPASTQRPGPYTVRHLAAPTPGLVQQALPQTEAPPKATLAAPASAVPEAKPAATTAPGAVAPAAPSTTPAASTTAPKS